MFLRGQGRQYRKMRGSWREECNPLHSRKGLHHHLPVEGDISSQAGRSKAVARMAGLVVKWGQWGAEEAQIVPMFILAQIPTRQHVESSQLIFQMIAGKALTTPAIANSWFTATTGEGRRAGWGVHDGNEESGGEQHILATSSCFPDYLYTIQPHPARSAWQPWVPGVLSRRQHVHSRSAIC